MSMRALVVDDTVVFRRLISEALSAMPGIEVVGTAPNGKMALARLAALKPDFMTLDIEMPEMNGIEVLEALPSLGWRGGVIVLSALTVRGGMMTVRALELGAFDFLTKPDGGTYDENLAQLRDRLQPMVRAFQRAHEIRAYLPVRRLPAPAAPLPAKPTQASFVQGGRARERTNSPLVLIGVSTGGPVALARLLPALPPNLGAPVLVVQHMPPLFTQPLAASLGAKCALRVKEACDGEIATENCVYIAPGGRQMKIGPGSHGVAVIRITDDPPENHCKPAVDYLFRSAALHFPGRSIAAVLTGMGNDGTLGLRMLKRTGCYTIAQDEASCVVFGVPKEAIVAGVIDVVLSLDDIAPAIVRSLCGGRA
jgi:two-component system, chemotaxis family, protein-glutamate methylesterase/glutaminase